MLELEGLLSRLFLSCSRTVQVRALEKTVQVHAAVSKHDYVLAIGRSIKEMPRATPAV